MPRKTQIRNHVARAPILRKGGAHIKSKTNQRFRTKKDIIKAVNEWKNKKND
jgi:hypothetical protein